jgi:hypothetical protein
MRPGARHRLAALHDARAGHRDADLGRVSRETRWVGVDALAMLSGFLGTLIHDGQTPHPDLLCKHGLCHAHPSIPCELTYVFEARRQGWAGRMIDRLLRACQEANESNMPLVFFPIPVTPLAP